jgi:3D-(3,5/4)-trihydroxycyclohexane-1,2-dione acylhydrolase (decyclizing)
LQAGAIGVTGATAANALAREADLVLAVGTRLQDFTTGSHALFPGATLVSLNVNPFDAGKWRGVPLAADARLGLQALSSALGGWTSDGGWRARAVELASQWRDMVARITSVVDVELPYDGEVIGAVQRSARDSPREDIVVCAAGTLPGELHKLWRTSVPGGYHVEYGYSCMGYEIAGAVGVKLARPDREVIVLVGDGSYLMLNSELATSVALGCKLIVVLLDNHGYGCIHRLQQACGGAPFNNLLAGCVRGRGEVPRIDYAAHARALGALGENAGTIAELEAALARARAADRSTLICIETDPTRSTEEGGCWWEVAVPEVSDRASVADARARYERDKAGQRL